MADSGGKDVVSKNETRVTGGASTGGAVGGSGGMPDISALLQDKEVLEAFQDPEVAAAFSDVSQNPENIPKYQNNPKVQKTIEKLVGKFGMISGGAPGSDGGADGAGGSNL